MRKSFLSATVVVLVLVSCFGSLPGQAVAADKEKPFMPSIFSDHMVLQRNKPIVLWGWTEPGAPVEITFRGNSHTTTAVTTGRWDIQLPAMDAGGPFEMTVQSGTQTRTIQDIHVGEVWLCSGQSNMWFPIKSTKDGPEYMKSADDPLIRIYNLGWLASDTPQNDVNAQWKILTAPLAPNTPAVPYHFARMLRKQLGVPVGLVHNAWPGMEIEPFISPDMLRSREEFQVVWDRYQKKIDEYPSLQEAYPAKLKEWTAAKKQAETDGKKPPKKPNPPKDPAAPSYPRRPGALYNAMVHPIAPYSLAGVIWYQGENNVGQWDEYPRLLASLIEDWRMRFRQEKMPFLYATLANGFDIHPVPAQGSGATWVWMREAQRKVKDMIPNVEYISLIDNQKESDPIWDVHPKDKPEVAERFFRAAMHLAYGDEDVVYSGPRLREAEFQDDSVVLHFEQIGGGLVVGEPWQLKQKYPDRDPKAPQGFAIAGEDKQWHWAEARIDGDTVVVHSDDVAKPVAVRYAWANQPIGNLRNAAGLPGVPFRTDDWQP